MVEATVKTRMNEELLRGFKRQESKRAVLLYSGGIDSTAAGILMRREGYEVMPLFIDYGQTALEAEEFVTTTYGPRLGFGETKIIRTDLLRQLSKSSLLGGTAKDDDTAWVPGRNTLFMVVAGIYASQTDSDGITLGYMLDDNFVFGDNDYFHHLEVQGVLSKSLLRPMKVFLPLMAMTKEQVIGLVNENNLLDNTVSCWNARVEYDRIIACHQCANCLERDRYTARR